MWHSSLWCGELVPLSGVETPGPPGESSGGVLRHLRCSCSRSLGTHLCSDAPRWDLALTEGENRRSQH